MTWEIKFSSKAEKQFSKLSNDNQKKIAKFIDSKLIIDPALHLITLRGGLKNYYKFRVGDYRLLCEKNENKLIVTVIKIGHRKEIYK